MDNHSNRRSEGNSGTNVREQVIALMKEGIRGRIPASKISELRRNLNSDEQVDAIQTAFLELQRETQHRAKKFTKFIDEKFRQKNYPLHTVLKESEKYRRKNNLSDVEYSEFKHQYQKMHTSRGENMDLDMLPSTNMALLFGDIYSTDGIAVKTEDYQALQDILKLHTMTKGVHSQVILQAMQYQGFPMEVAEAEYDSTRHNVSCAVNPVIVAMFAMKMNGFDHHFLYSNISYIVKCKYEKERIDHTFDRELLHAMILDSNDVVCSDKSVMADLRMRANVQNNLWNCVLQLRSGKFFECTNNDFFSAIEECKIFRQDAPDLIYTGDEHVIMRRLFAAMSFNPTLVNTTPIFGTGTQGNVVDFPVLDNTARFLPFFVVRIPDVNTADESQTVILDDAISRPQVYHENGVYVPKKQTVIATRGDVIIFHVPRRSIAAANRFQSMISTTPRFTQVPSHVLINERINDFKIEYNPIITISPATYGLVSAVVLETPIGMEEDKEEQKHKIIIGNATIIRNTPIGNKMNFAADHVMYSPKLLPSQQAKSGASVSIKKVWDDVSDQADTILAHHGTIFVFEEITAPV
jgi:hypothetical protein